MKRGLFAAAAVAVLLMTGCSSSVTEETVTLTPGASGTFSNGDSTVVVEPLTAESPSAEADNGEAAFLAEVRENLRPDNVIPNATDEQLLQAGYRACELLANRQNGEEISVIDGEQTDQSGYYRDSAQIVTAAAMTIC